MNLNYPKPRRNQIIASKGSLAIRRLIQWVMTAVVLFVMVPAILFSATEFFTAVVSWIFIVLIFYVFLKPAYNFIYGKIFNYEERYRKQIIERLLYFYSHRTNVGWDKAKEYVDFIAEAYPTASALEAWLES